MNLPKKDVIATSLVALAGVLYLLWVTGSAPPGMSGTRATGIVILALGFAASATAVVPGFGQLLSINCRETFVATAVNHHWQRAAVLAHHRKPAGNESLVFNRV